MEKRAYAKINLSLDVLGKREDGYHTLRMIMESVNLYDVLTLEKTETPGVVLTTDEESLPCNEKNLAFRAAKLLLEEFSLSQGVSIHLEKHIPMAAGMAGGSSDAAAVLHGVNELFDLGLTLEELQKRGLTLGADVPYCLMGGTALAEGVGEILTPLPSAGSLSLLLAKPPIAVSTAFVFQNLHLTEETVHPKVEAQQRAIEEKNLRGVVENLGNVLEEVTVKHFPVIEELKEHMLAEGALGALMSGSGPTVFGIFPGEKEAEAAKKQLAAAFPNLFLQVTTNRV